MVKSMDAEATRRLNTLSGDIAPSRCGTANSTEKMARLCILRRTRRGGGEERRGGRGTGVHGGGTGSGVEGMGGAGFDKHLFGA